MENLDVLEAMDLPPGFRFHPTDEELITHYLSPKVIDVTFSTGAIGEVDLNKCEPWDLPKKAKMGEKEWYFFCVRDRKYPTGLRTNRATEAGYWKATGKDKEIYREKILVGMKKTLVFYKGRAPKGKKSNWVMHEFRRQGKSALPSNSKNEWVICRVFQKNAAGKKIPFEELIRSDSFGTDFNPSTNLPPLMEASPYNANLGAPHVSCFSTSMEITQTSHYHTNDQAFFDGSINNTLYSQIASSFGDNSCYYNYYHLQTGQNPEDPILKAILQNGAETKTEVGNYSALQDTGLSSDINHEMSSVVSNYDVGPMPFDGSNGPSTSVRSVDFDSLWNS